MFHFRKGEKGNSIFLDVSDKKNFLALVARSSAMFRSKVIVFCLMTTHYHILLQTAEANLSRVMRYIGGVFTQRMNRKYKMDGHLFRGRYKAILIDKDSYLLEVIRCIHLNPVRAGIVKRAEDHGWTSHRLLQEH
jgi:REP element-mobilizing transposase RayT